MKVWITQCCNEKNIVLLYASKPIISIYSLYNVKNVAVCRSKMAKLLRESGKKLPKYGSKDIVEIELVAR